MKVCLMPSNRSPFFTAGNEMNKWVEGMWNMAVSLMDKALLCSGYGVRYPEEQSWENFREKIYQIIG